jgi:hypothetical protein
VTADNSSTLGGARVQVRLPSLQMITVP